MASRVLFWRTNGEMARRIDYSKDVMNRQELETSAKRLEAMSVTAIRDFYGAAYWACRLNDDEPPKARHIQELVTAWKQMHWWGKKRDAG